MGVEPTEASMARMLPASGTAAERRGGEKLVSLSVRQSLASRVATRAPVLHVHPWSS